MGKISKKTLRKQGKGIVDTIRYAVLLVVAVFSSMELFYRGNNLTLLVLIMPAIVDTFPNLFYAKRKFDHIVDMVVAIMLFVALVLLALVVASGVQGEAEKITKYVIKCLTFACSGKYAYSMTRAYYKATSKSE